MEILTAFSIALFGGAVLGEIAYRIDISRNREDAS